MDKKKTLRQLFDKVKTKDKVTLDISTVFKTVENDAESFQRYPLAHQFLAELCEDEVPQFHTS